MSRITDYIKRCDLLEQYKCYRRQIDKAVINVLKQGVYTLGKEVEQFEKEFAKYIGRAYGIAVASGTDALILALKVAGIKKGTQVITSTYAPVPVPTAIVLAGGVPVFTDIEENTCLMDPNEVAKKISSKTEFIIPVHLFGSVCNMTAISELARRNKLLVIEDAAQAHGSSLGGKKAGSFGGLSCFSFYPTKNLGGYGDGGIVLTDSRKTADGLRLLRNYGKKYNSFDSESLGFNSRLDELQANILRVKLRHLEKMNRRRADLAKLYKKGLKNTSIVFLKAYDNSKPNYHVLTILCNRNREGMIRFLQSNRIQTNIYYPKPLHLMRAFRKYAKKGERFPVSERISKQAIALPLYPELKKEKVMFVIEKIKKFLAKENS